MSKLQYNSTELKTYIVTFKIEGFDEYAPEEYYRDDCNDILTSALNIFLSLFDRNGAYLYPITDMDSIIRYSQLRYSEMAEMPLDQIDDSFSEIIQSIVGLFLQHTHGVNGDNEILYRNTKSFYSLLYFYYDCKEIIVVRGHVYFPETHTLKLFIY